MKWQGKVVQFHYWRFLHHCCGRMCLGLLCSLFQSKNPFIRRNLLAAVAFNVSSVSIKQFDSIIALCTTRHVLSNTVALSNMLRRKNINLIQVTKPVGVAVNVMTEERNDPMVWDELCWPQSWNGSRLWHETQHDAFMCSATTPHQCANRYVTLSDISAD